MHDERLQAIAQVKRFLEGSESLEFRGLSTEEGCKWAEITLVKFNYKGLKKAENGGYGSIHRRLQNILECRHPD